MIDEKIGKIIENAVVEKDGKRRLSCAKAFIIAGDFGVGLTEISRYCDLNQIKISNCQLGCF